MPGIKSALSYYNRIMASSDPTPQKRPCRRRHDTKVGHSMQREHLHCAQPPSLLFAILFSRGNNFFLSNGFETDLEENFILILMIHYTVDCIEVILHIFFELSFTYSLIHTHNHRRFTVCRIRKFFFRSVWKRKKEKRKKTDNLPNRSEQTVTDRRQRPVNISKSDQSGADPHETQEKGWSQSATPCTTTNEEHSGNNKRNILCRERDPCVIPQSVSI